MTKLTIGSASVSNLKVGDLRELLTQLPEDLAVAALYDEGAAGGSVVGAYRGGHPEDGSDSFVVVVA